MIKEKEKESSKESKSKRVKKRVKIIRSEDVCVWDRGKIGISSSNLSAWLRQKRVFIMMRVCIISDNQCLECM